MKSIIAMSGLNISKEDFGTVWKYFSKDNMETIKYDQFIAAVYQDNSPRQRCEIILRDSETATHNLDTRQKRHAEHLISQLAVFISSSSSQRVSDLFADVEPSFNQIGKRLQEINPMFNSHDVKLISAYTGAGESGLKNLIHLVEKQTPGYTYLTARRLLSRGSLDLVIRSSNFKPEIDEVPHKSKHKKSPSQQNDMPVGAERDYCFPASERFRATSRDIGSDLTLIRDAEYFSKLRKQRQYENKLERYRRNQARVEEAYKYEREGEINNQEKRVKGLIRQKMAYLERISEKLELEKMKERTAT
jgi:hypothetical protein